MTERAKKSDGSPEQLRWQYEKEPVVRTGYCELHKQTSTVERGALDRGMVFFCKGPRMSMLGGHVFLVEYEPRDLKAQARQRWVAKAQKGVPPAPGDVSVPLEGRVTQRAETKKRSVLRLKRPPGGA